MIHTHQRMTRAHLAEDEDPTCQFSNGEEEYSEHMICKCPAFSHLRIELWKLISPTQLSAMPPCTKSCGILLEDPEVVELGVLLSKEVEPSVSPIPCTPDDRRVERIMHGKVVAATDGAASHAADYRFRRSGFGIYFGEGHTQNVSRKCYGATHSAIRSEIYAILHSLKYILFAASFILCDNKSVVDMFSLILQGHFDPTWEHIDLWNIIRRVIDIRGVDYFSIKWIPSHTKEQHILDGIISREDRYMNEQADKLATAGAKLHTIDRRIIDRAKHRLKLAVELQKTACNILHERARTLPLAGRRAGYSATEHSNLHVIQDANIHIHEEASEPLVDNYDDHHLDDFNELDELEHMYDADVLAANELGFDLDRPVSNHVVAVLAYAHVHMWNAPPRA